MQFFGYFERFAFRGFNFWDRATRAEYWCVMPVIWALIVLAFVWDVREVWQFLLRREAPPLNPLYYDSFLLFFLTLIPRMSLTVRRLHDSNKSGRWCTLPITAVLSGVMLMIGIIAVIVTSGVAGLGDAEAEGLGIGLVFMLLYMGQMETFWQGMFAAAAALNAIGWDAVLSILSDLMSRAQTPQVGEVAATFRENVQKNPSEGVPLLLILVATISTPFVAALMHLYFMLLPSDRDHNAFGDSSVAPITGAPKPKTGGTPQHNPLEGYACLFEKTPEEQARIKQAQQAELKALYRSRVLGERETPAQ